TSMRHRSKLLAGGAVAVALLAGVLFGGVLEESPSARSTAVVPPQAISENALSGIVQGGAQATVASLETALASSPSDPDTLASLGLAYQIRWRETGDASYLPRSNAALAAALTARPDDPTATLGLGNLALLQHQFARALVVGRRAQKLAPHSARPYGVIGDAQIELGRYTAAFSSFERMVALKPNLASYARIAYARELKGDTVGAIAAMRLAVDAAGGQPDATAWALVELAKLEFGRGRVTAADTYARAALTAVPGYVYALEQRARIEAARGRLDSSIALARRASEAIPLAQFVSLLGDLLERRGRLAEARQQRATVAAIDRLLVAGGVRVDLESAVYRADQRIRPVETVALARRARADRPSIYGDDALGWALARAGRCDEAVTWSRRSLRLGTRDAQLWFHHGYAAGCAGDTTEMARAYEKALALNPNFSVRFAPLARKAVS
ncbi:tetratricopeptide repeat protein, partial [Gaiella sp.]|uniref:tetratricopeptide repeat protein n=1 Tax=Gaiella sp. TaxID=2663207 RepID=UPI003983946C